MVGSGGLGPLGSDSNSPVIDPGTLSRSTHQSPRVSGSKLPILQARRPGIVSGTSTSAKGYVIVEARLKAMFPRLTWERARTRINELFKEAGGLQAVYLDKKASLPRLNLTDGVVECHQNSAQATYDFRLYVYNSLNALGRKISWIAPLAREIDGEFRRPIPYKVGAGRAHTLKGIYRGPADAPELVCLAFAVANLQEAFSVWAGLLTNKTQTTMATILNAPEKEQLGLGIVLGNLIAHELRHQLAKGKGLPEANSGLGMQGADFADLQIKFTDENDIRQNLHELGLLQRKYERGSFGKGDILK